MSQIRSLGHKIMKNLFSLSTPIFHSFHKCYFPNEKNLYDIIYYNSLKFARIL